MHLYFDECHSRSMKASLSSRPRPSIDGAHLEGHGTIGQAHRINALAPTGVRFVSVMEVIETVQTGKVIHFDREKIGSFIFRAN